jgi:hypothetical protein
MPTNDVILSELKYLARDTHTRLLKLYPDTKPMSAEQEAEAFPLPAGARLAARVSANGVVVRSLADYVIEKGGMCFRVDALVND